MTFLKKLGLALAKGLQIVTGLQAAGVKLPLGIQIADTLSRLIEIVVNVEAFSASLESPISGPEKLKAAAALIAKELVLSAPFAGKKIAKPELMEQAAAKIADGIVDALNAVHESEVKTENVPS